MPQESIGKRIKRVRISHGWTQGELGAKLGVGQSQVSRWERDQGEMWPSTRCEISAILGVPLEWLNSGMEPSARQEDSGQSGIRPIQALRKAVHALAHAAAAKGASLDLDLAVAVVTDLAQQAIQSQQSPTTENAIQALERATPTSIRKYS
ncbi:helix-turn-helix domain-containing protein [Holophaga foetida]|uniref:helix-turn-helix domain-containing protein n=1 Tax=Holophaga foetida TaxID=35839 RepID=UPI00024750B7|nr:helix-turn-helix transcriptional regulator [Holophaga foetida]